VLSQDASGHWVLWNRQTAAQVMQGNVLCSSSSCEDTNLAGSTLVVGKQIRSAVDGSLRATLTVPGAQCWWKLATDGSYIAYGCDNGLYVWDSNGASLLTRTGEYTFSQALAAPTELRVAARRAAPQVLEKISIPGAVSADFTFLGEFRSWFADGERFLTVDGSNTVRVYGASGGAPQPQDTRVLASVEGLAGVGNYFYAKRALRYLDIYSVGASASPAASYDFVTAFTAVPSATTVGALTISGVSVIDLAGVAPVKVDFASPVASDIYSATSPTDWVIGNREGVVADVATSPGAPRYFGFGDALDVVAGEQFFAVATASGRIVYFDSSTLDQEGVIDFFARKLELSADGTVLAAGTIGDNGQYYRTDRTLKIFSLPSGTEVRSWPATDTDAQLPWDFTLSASGDVVGRVLRALGAFDFTREVSAVAGGAPSWSDTLSLTSPLGLTGVDLPIRLSPSGAVIAVPDGFARPESITRLISSADGSVIAQAQGWIGGFVDENRLLLAIGRGNPRQAPSALFSTTTGQQLDVLDGFYGFEFQTVDADRIYNNSRIYSLTSKQFTWISDTQGLGGGVTPTHAVFKAGASIRAEVY
jgi:hypothetical protein